ncbi:hypothetical protein L2X99_16075 [Microbacterium sp. KUDC0406]|uniref:endo-beta-N-acetylglucosaminidase n=1 Tax=Microbacterium sp. KUDC0406 TaxID=2909588 RepID=UPI001F3BE764|nr:hypothetical protein [Microbacterium sp. KUDC0406]UJP09872.1 hypothetical protein L2X99_16075 [Microbacterium sp. KUDC0406]
MQNNPRIEGPTFSRRTLIRVAGLSALGAAVAGPMLSNGAAFAADAEPAALPVPGMGGIPDGPSTWGWNAPELLDFDPATSPWARHLRCLIPRAARIEPFAPTQAHPDLSPATQLSTLTFDDAGSLYRARNQAIGIEPYVYTQRYWPYIDVWGPWHGQFIPSITEDVVASGRTGFGGVMDIPNPGWVEAAHKNGARAIGGWFWPRGTANFNDFLVQREDGSFPVADKMIEIKQYFGFDGFFINQEATITKAQVDKLFAMFRYIKAKDSDFYLQYYDAVIWNTGRLAYQNKLNATNVGALGSPGDRVIDSIFVNYGWPTADKGAVTGIATAKAAGFAPTEVAFYALEMQKGGFNPTEDFGTLAGPGKDPSVSVALFVEDNYWGDAATAGKVHSVEGRRTYRDYERKMWSGPKGNPAESGRLEQRPGGGRVDTMNYRYWDGIAHWIVERSSYSSLPIDYNVNIGVGSEFRLGGELVSDRGWDNQGIADRTLTWQYWTEGDLKVDIDETDAWEGGHSLTVSGSGILHCFKTDLAIRRAARARVRVKGDVRVEVGLTLRSDPDRILWRRMKRAGVAGGWATLDATLPALPGARVARISLRVSGSGRIGGIQIAERATTDRRPSAVTGLTASDEGLTKNEKVLRNVSFTWNLEKTAASYDVLQVTDAGDRWLGRVQRDAFYALSIDLGQGSTFKVVSIDAIGNRSAATSVRVVD